LADLRNFFGPYLQKGENDGCYYLGSNPAWNTACWPSGNPILHCAAQNGCTALVYLILTEYLPRGSELINFQRKKKGYTPLHLAVYFKKKEVEEVRRKRLKEVEELLLEWGAKEDIRCTEKGGKKDETVLILREERDGSLPQLPKSTVKSRKAAREMQEKRPYKFEREKKKYPAANGPASGNGRRTYAPQVQKTKPEKNTNQVDDDGFETVQTPALQKTVFEKANLSDLLDLLENNI
jgi:hypothetical protein